MNNFMILIKILNQNPESKNLEIKENAIGYQGKFIDLTNFDYYDFYSKNTNFKNNLQNLNAEAIFKIIEIHAKFYNQKSLAKQLTEDDFKEIAKNNKVLQKFHLVHNHKKVEDVTKNYVHFLDSQGKNHLLCDITGEELLKAYDSLIRNFKRDVTEEELYNYLKSMKKSMELECLNEALMRNNTTEEHLNNLKMLNDRNHETGNTLDTPLGNDKEKIYISNGIVTTFNLNKNNEYVKENHEISTGSGESLSTDQKPQEEKVIEEEKIPLITFEEYTKLILKPGEYSKEDDEKIKVFENYIFDVITYKDYLIPEIYEYYTKFYEFANYLYTIKNPDENITKAIERYEDMFARSKNVSLENVEEKAKKLIRTNPNLDKIGFTSIAIYIAILLIAIGMIIAIFINIKG